MFFSCDLTVETWSSYGLFILNQSQKETNIILSEIAYPSSLKRNLHVVYPSFRLWFYMMPPFGLPPPPSTPDNYYTVPKLCLSLSAKQRRNHFFWFPTCVPRFEYAWRFPAPPPPLSQGLDPALHKLSACELWIFSCLFSLFSTVWAS